jgi:hypothetical protein
MRGLVSSALWLLPMPLWAQAGKLPEGLIDMHFHVWDSVPSSGGSRDVLLAAVTT